MKLLILIFIVYVNKKGQIKNSMEFYTFFLWEEFYTFDFKVCLGLLNKLNSYARLSLIPILFLFLFIYSYYLIVYTLKIFLCVFCKSFLIWKKIKNDIKQLSELIIFFFNLSLIYIYIYIYSKLGFKTHLGKLPNYAFNFL